MSPLERLAACDAATWGTGLSPEGARLALAEALAPLRGLDPRALLPPGRLFRPPERLLIWCSANVFTAPLEWAWAFSALGSRVRLKAPAAHPEATQALGEALGAEVCALPHDQAWPLLDEADAVLGFGSDAAMATLAARLPPATRRSLHGHRVSFALVQGHDADTAAALALDHALHDGQGCMSPAAVLCTGDARALAEALHAALAELEARVPRGPLPPAAGPEWRTRRALARAEGHLLEGAAHAVATLPLARLRPAPAPRFAVVHPVQSLREAAEALRGLPLSTAATDHAPAEALAAMGFLRVCRPGHMQRPPFPRPHDGVDVLRTLCAEVSLECP